MDSSQENEMLCSLARSTPLAKIDSIHCFPNACQAGSKHIKVFSKASFNTKITKYNRCNQLRKVLYIYTWATWNSCFKQGRFGHWRCHTKRERRSKRSQAEISIEAAHQPHRTYNTKNWLFFAVGLFRPKYGKNWVNSASNLTTKRMRLSSGVFRIL